MNNLPKELKERIGSLPVKVQKAILDTNIEDALIDLSKKYDLLLDQISALETEVILVMTGLEEGKDFVDNLVGEVGVNTQTAISIATDIENTIFEEMRENLQKEEGTEEQDQSTDRKKTLEAIERPKRTGESYGVFKPNKKDKTGEMQKTGAMEKQADPETAESEQKSDDASEVLESKMSGIVPGKNKSAEEEGGEKKYPGGEDPYREPIE